MLLKTLFSHGTSLKTAVANPYCSVILCVSKYWKLSSRLHESSIFGFSELVLAIFFASSTSWKWAFYGHHSLVFNMITCFNRKKWYFVNLRKTLFFHRFFNGFSFPGGVPGHAESHTWMLGVTTFGVDAHFDDICSENNFLQLLLQHEQPLAQETKQKGWTTKPMYGRNWTILLLTPRSLSTCSAKRCAFLDGLAGEA